MSPLKIMAVTTSRADYGLLHPLLVKLHQDQDFALQLVVTGSHLSAVHGLTIKQIEEDGLPITGQVEINMTGDREADLCTGIAHGIQEFSSLYQQHQPDLLLVLGDRYELWAACLPAIIHKVPIAHIHGGEVTQGAMDDTIRHSITKMASLHFPAMPLYAQRILQMGEPPERVFAVGALGIDNIQQIPLMTCDALSDFCQFDFSQDVALMTYHPVTLDNYASAGAQIQEVLSALTESGLPTLITMPNADTGSLQIYEALQAIVQSNPKQFHLVKSLGQKGYLSAMKYARLMIGNSSSAIIESASFHVPVVDIGDRQAGRFKPQNVIETPCESSAILAAIQKALSPQFAQSLSTLENPFGTGDTAKQIIKILKSIDWSDTASFLKKGFRDLEIAMPALPGRMR